LASWLRAARTRRQTAGRADWVHEIKHDGYR
jgi:ATP-dependent DNA ligase